MTNLHTRLKSVLTSCQGCGWGSPGIWLCLFLRGHVNQVHKLVKLLFPLINLIPSSLSSFYAPWLNAAWSKPCPGHPLIFWGNFNTATVTHEDPHTHPAPLTMGNSGNSKRLYVPTRVWLQKKPKVQKRAWLYVAGAAPPPTPAPFPSRPARLCPICQGPACNVGNWHVQVLSFACLLTCSAPNTVPASGQTDRHAQAHAHRHTHNGLRIRD